MKSQPARSAAAASASEPTCQLTRAPNARASHDELRVRLAVEELDDAGAACGDGEARGVEERHQEVDADDAPGPLRRAARASPRAAPADSIGAPSIASPPASATAATRSGVAIPGIAASWIGAETPTSFVKEVTITRG